jgi:hypothetical protein
VQKEVFPVAWFIAVWIPVRQLDVRDVQVPAELITAYVAPAWAAALADMRANIPVPRSVAPSVRIRKNGKEIAASIAAVPSKLPNKWRKMRIMIIDIGMDWRVP